MIIIHYERYDFKSMGTMAAQYSRIKTMRRQDYGAMVWSGLRSEALAFIVRYPYRTAAFCFTLIVMILSLVSLQIDLRRETDVDLASKRSMILLGTLIFAALVNASYNLTVASFIGYLSEKRSWLMHQKKLIDKSEDVNHYKKLSYSTFSLAENLKFALAVLFLVAFLGFIVWLYL